ncbi:MAG: hypothetical protein OHK0052_11830 [Anaerolineales bacterium]
MGGWPGKFIIGLTGNIATGKSVVRKMLEHLEAYTIDADALSHRAIAAGSPGYKAVVDLFGKWILDAEGQIDRAKLGRLTFADPAAMQKLESIIHPLVRQAIDILARRATQKVVVIEAIKLLDGDLYKLCDSIWVTQTTPEIQLARLVQKRGMTEADARQRIAVQGDGKDKLARANVVIHNSGSFEETWRQVSAAWQTLFPTADTGAVEVAQTAAPAAGSAPAAGLALKVVRGKPRQASEIAEFITRMSGGKRKMTRDDVMAAFGEKAFMLLKAQDKIVGIMGWQVENLVTRVNDMYIEDSIPLVEAAGPMLEQVEQNSRELQCEAALLFVPPHLAQQSVVWQRVGYDQRDIDGLGVRAWQEAARESAVPGMVMLFKQLRQDRVLRPV